MNDTGNLNVIGLYLTNDQIVIGHLVNSEATIDLDNPYNLRINHEGQLEFIPYLREFTNDNIISFNMNSVINAFAPHDKYITKYVEIYNKESKTLLS